MLTGTNCAALEISYGNVIMDDAIYNTKKCTSIRIVRFGVHNSNSCTGIITYATVPCEDAIFIMALNLPCTPVVYSEPDFLCS